MAKMEDLHANEISDADLDGIVGGTASASQQKASVAGTTKQDALNAMMQQETSQKESIANQQSETKPTGVSETRYPTKA